MSRSERKKPTRGRGQRGADREKSGGLSRRAIVPGEPPWARIAAGALLCAAALYPIINCLQPIFYDEAFMLRYYVAQSFGYISTTYDLPNNHIGLSWILRLWVLLCESASHSTYWLLPVWVLRLPVVALALIGYGAFYLFAKRGLSANRLIAAAATAMMASVQLVVHHSFQMRGYMPSVTYFSGLLALVVWFDKIPAAVGAGLITFCAFAAQYTLPSNAWFLLPLTVGVAALGAVEIRARQREHLAAGSKWWAYRRALYPAAAMVAGGALSILASIPVLSQISKQKMGPRTAGEFFANVITHFAQLCRGIAITPWPWLDGTLLLAGMLCCIEMAWRENETARKAALLTIPPVVLGPVVAAASAPSAFPRNYAVAAPFAATLLCWLIFGIWTAVSRKSDKSDSGANIQINERNLLLSFSIAAAAALLFGWGHAAKLWLDHRPDEIVRFLKTNAANAPVGVDIEADAMAIDYYSTIDGLQQHPVGYDVLPRDLPQRAPAFYLIGQPSAVPPMMTFFGLPATSASPNLQKVAQIGACEIWKYTASPKNKL